MPACWHLYLLRCSDGSLYTGIAIDPEQRLLRHNAGKGSRYVAAHRPAILLDFAGCYTRSVATRLELWLKSLPPGRKLLALQLLKAGLIDEQRPQIPHGR